jgi:SAM-dependent methyltransferase
MTLPFSQQSFPEMYERVLVDPLFRPWVASLLDRVDLAANDRVLDIACGTGIVARCVRQRLGSSGTVVGVDVNGGMLAVARRLGPDVEWREGDATNLPLAPGEQFDVVTCQQGLQFVSDKAAAARQLRRALAPNGRVAVSCWRPDEQFTVLRELKGVVERRLGVQIEDRRHSFGEPGPLEGLLKEAGFREIRSASETRTVRFEDGAQFVRLNAMALVGMSPAAKGLAEEERARLIDLIVTESAAIVRAHTDAAGFAYEIGTNVTVARVL